LRTILHSRTANRALFRATHEFCPISANTYATEFNKWVLIMADRRGVKNKLNGAQRAQIATMVENGVSDNEIARAFSVHRTTILRLRHGFECENAKDAEPEAGTLLHFLWRTERRKANLGVQDAP
jgi:Homeodomain-like domain-containing protein